MQTSLVARSGTDGRQKDSVICSIEDALFRRPSRSADFGVAACAAEVAFACPWRDRHALKFQGHMTLSQSLQGVPGAQEVRRGAGECCVT